MKNNFELFHKVITKFHFSGILKHVILIGSWALPVYKYYFSNSPEIPILRTSDIDFLIPNPPKINNQVDVPKILKMFEFEEKFALMGNHTKFVHPDLEIEFLIPELGRGNNNKSILIKEYNVTALPLRYLYFIQNHTLEVEYSSGKILVPEPTVFVLLKFLIALKRNNKNKVDKDIATAVELSEFLLQRDDQVKKFEKYYAGMPKTWQKKLIQIIENNSPELYDLLCNK